MTNNEKEELIRFTGYTPTEAYNHKKNQRNAKEIDKISKQAKECHMTYGQYVAEQFRKMVTITRSW